MSKSKSKFTVVDFILVFAVVVIIASSVLRNVNVSQFNLLNSFEDSIITISIDGIDKEYFEFFKNTYDIYVTDDGDNYEFGTVKSIRSTPAVYPVLVGDKYELTTDFSKIDIVMDVKAECLFDERGFCSIKHNYIAPGCEFNADNGKIKFNFEIVSIKSSD